MKKILFTLALAALQTMAMAIPAKRGIWKEITLNDGTTLKVELRGDEFSSWWQAADGRCFTQDIETQKWTLTDKQVLKEQALKARSLAAPLRKVSIGGDHPDFVGKKKGLIILAEFTDQKFAPGHDAEYYSHVANDLNFTHPDGYVGSIRDFFLAQSNGVFDLTFDVVGPISLRNNMAYYGANTTSAHDCNPSAMVAEAAEAAANLKKTFAEYDWFGDGYVDQVFVIYAGRGEADGGDPNTIWPHRYNLAYARSLGGKLVSQYACSNELQSDGKGGTKTAGIGAFCHEFSHCLGLADVYDTANHENYGMKFWDIMDSGNYLGESFTPCSYSCFERTYCGWMTPIELNKDTEITGMKGISEGGECYIIYNDAYKSEYYTIEARTKTGWDKDMFGEGLIITHIDFDKNIWSQNKVNVTDGKINTHERYTLFHADNDDKTTQISMSVDPYPYRANNRLTDTSQPASDLYHPNAVGRKYMSKPITRIKRNTDGTYSFVFKNMVGKIPEGLPKGVIFRETFADATGAGGNDGLWSGTNVGNNYFNADNEGWESNKKYAADQCALFGASLQAGKVVTPEIEISGETTLMFLAAPWTNEAKSLTLSVASGDATLGETSFALEKDKWTKYTTTLTGNGKVTIQFKANSKRFFLDEVYIVTPEYDAIEDIQAADRDTDPRAFNLMGVQVNGDAKGLIIRNGKKYVIK